MADEADILEIGVGAPVATQAGHNSLMFMPWPWKSGSKHHNSVLQCLQS